MNFLGMRVHVVPDYLCEKPKMQLSKEFADMMPRDWVNSTNIWLKNFFGVEHCAYIISGNSIFTTAQNVSKIKNLTPPEQGGTTK